MNVSVLLFASHREALGESKLRVDVPEGASVEAVYDALAERAPVFRALRASTTFAVNREVVAPSFTVRAGDEIAFLQPVSGGSCA